jgi:hypothetical protein
VAIPPPLGADRAAEARAVDAHIAAITARRDQVDDPHRWQLTDKPADVLDYLRTHPGAGMPAELRRADIIDGLALTVAQEWQQRRDQLMLLERAEREGMLAPHSDAWRPLGALLGMTTPRGRRGLAARLDRLREQFYGSGIPSEKLWRARHQPPAGAPAGSTPAGTAGRDSWLAAHAGQLRQVAAVLYGQRGHPADDEYQWLDELHELADGGPVTPGMVTVLRYAAATLIDVPDEPVQAALDQLGGLLNGYQHHQ